MSSIPNDPMYFAEALFIAEENHVELWKWSVRDNGDLVVLSQAGQKFVVPLVSINESSSHKDREVAGRFYKGPYDVTGQYFPPEGMPAQDVTGPGSVTGTQSPVMNQEDTAFDSSPVHHDKKSGTGSKTSKSKNKTSKKGAKQ